MMISLPALNIEGIVVSNTIKRVINSQPIISDEDLAQQALEQTDKLGRVQSLEIYANYFNEIEQESNQLESICFLNDEDNLISKMVKDIYSKIYDSDENAIFLIALGVLSSAVSARHKVNFFDNVIPTNLYVACGADAGKAKTTIVNRFYNPIQKASTKFNNKFKVERDIANTELKSHRINYKEAIANGDASSAKDAYSKIQETTNKAKQYAMLPERALCDATPEAAAESARRNGGKIHFVDSEGEAIKRMLSSDNDANADYQLILKGYLGEQFGQERVNRGSNAFNAIVSLSVFVQPNVFNLIADAGKQGRGVIDRFMLYMCKSKPVDDKYGLRTDPFCADLYSQYGRLVDYLINSPETIIKLSTEAEDALYNIKNRYWEKLSHGGQYANIRSYIDKADQRIIKIASILHCVEAFELGRPTSITMSAKTIERAYKIDLACCDSYAFITDAYQATEMHTLKESVISFLQLKAESGVYRISQTIILKNFKRGADMKEKITNIILPDLVSAGYCHSIKRGKGQVYLINPLI